MIFFIALPLVLFFVLVLDVMAQQAFAHFTDVDRVTRRLLLTLILWLSLGWLLEQRLAIRVATVASVCQTSLEERYDSLVVTYEDFIGRGAR